jgi:acyl-CoA thioester hydrolase
MYSHMNNSLYYHLFDSIVNSYLIEQCSLKPSKSSSIGLVVHSHCDYFAPLGFPAVTEVGLRVNKLGRSSVTYEIGVFEQGVPDVRAVGEFVHVFVDREGMRPLKDGLSKDIRDGLRLLLTEPEARESKI